jgi:mRNA interferase MazF
MPGAIFEAFDVVVVPFPFTDKTTTRRRPALVISNADFNATHDHAVLAMITAARRSDWPSDTTLSSWRDAGLIAPCRVRLKLFTLPLERVLTRLGALGDSDRAAVHDALAASLPPLI